MIKAELRKIYLAKQKKLTSNERLNKSLQICNILFEQHLVENLAVFHVFLPIEKNNEVNTSFIINHLRQMSKTIVIPRVNFEINEIESFEFNSDTQFLINKWNISEPIGNNHINSKNIDAVIVPLLCFDKKGFRAGYGKGFYDKFLINCRTDCLKIGVSFFPPIEEIKDINEYDVTLDYCVTPQRVFNFSM